MQLRILAEELESAAHERLTPLAEDRRVSRAVARCRSRRYGEGHRVVRASSGQEALEALKELKLRGEAVAARSWA